MCVIRNHPDTDTWPWDTAEQVEATPDTMPAPESRAATSLTGATTATDAEVVDGRYGTLERMRREPRGPPAAEGRPFRLPVRIKLAGINMTYEGLIPRIQRSMLSKDKEGMQPHIREFVDRAVTFTTCPACAGTRLSEAARSSKIKDISIADACAMQISDLAEWIRGLDEPSVAPLLAALQQTLDSFWGDRTRLPQPRPA